MGEVIRVKQIRLFTTRAGECSGDCSMIVNSKRKTGRTPAKECDLLRLRQGGALWRIIIPGQLFSPYRCINRPTSAIVILARQYLVIVITKTLATMTLPIVNVVGRGDAVIRARG